MILICSILYDFVSQVIPSLAKIHISNYIEIGVYWWVFFSNFIYFTKITKQVRTTYINHACWH